jgi:hypothetical protein
VSLHASCYTLTYTPAFRNHGCRKPYIHISIGTETAACENVLSEINPLNPQFVEIVLKNLVRAANNTQHFTITKMSWLMMFKEEIAVYYENHVEHINTKCRVTDC